MVDTLVIIAVLITLVIVTWPIIKALLRTMAEPKCLNCDKHMLFNRGYGRYECPECGWRIKL